jgi:hypothetical protein
MNLEEWSWIAAILAIPLGIVVWLVDRKQVIGFFKSCWPVILLLFVIVAFIAACFRGWFNWLAHSVTLPVWVLILLVFLGLLLATAARLLSATFGTSSIRIESSHVEQKQREIIRQEQTPQQKPLQPAQPEPHDYTRDEVFGVKWSWRWHGHQFGDLMGPFCPRSNCVCRLDQERCSDPNMYNPRNAFTMPISLVCPHCGFKRDYEYDFSELTRKTMTEIERRINSGDFRNRLNS